MTRRAYKRSMGVRFGSASPVAPIDFLTTGGVDPFQGIQRSFSNLDDDGIRLEVDLTRTLTTNADRGKIRFWNLSQRSHDAIQADYSIRQALRKAAFRIKLPQPARAEALQKINLLHKVSVFAGYQGAPEGIFSGDMIRVGTRKREGPVDFVTDIELGDQWLGIRDGFVDNPLGPGVTLPALLDSLVQTMGARTGADAAAKIALVTPDAKITAWQNGAIGQLPAKVSLDDLGGLLKVVFFIRDGEMFMLGTGEVISDFALAVIEGRDVLDFTEGENDDEIRVRVNLDGRVQPGRAIYMFDAKRLPFPGNPFRVEVAHYRGDSHGNDFFVEFTATKFLGPAPRFLPGELA